MAKDGIINLIINGIDKYSKTLTGLQAGLSLVKSAFNTVTWAAEKTASAVFAVGSYMVDNASAFEQMEVRFEGVFGSQSAAEKALKWGQEFAATTPNSIAEVTNAMALMKSAGMDPMDGSLRILGDSAANMTIRVTELIPAFRKLNSGGKATYESLQQLGDKGINVFKILGEQLDLTANQVTKISDMNIDGKIVSDALLRGMRANEGAMQRMSDTAVGSISTIKDQFVQASLAVTNAGVWDTVTEKLRIIRDYISEFVASDDFAAWAKETGTSISSALNFIWDLASGFVEFGRIVWTATKESFGGVFEVIRSVFSNLGSNSGMVEFFKTFGSYLADTIALTSSFAQDFIGAFGPMAGVFPTVLKAAHAFYVALEYQAYDVTLAIVKYFGDAFFGIIDSYLKYVEKFPKLSAALGLTHTSTALVVLRNSFDNVSKGLKNMRDETLKSDSIDSLDKLMGLSTDYKDNMEGIDLSSVDKFAEKLGNAFEKFKLPKLPPPAPKDLAGIEEARKKIADADAAAKKKAIEQMNQLDEAAEAKATKAEVKKAKQQAAAFKKLISEQKKLAAEEEKLAAQGIKKLNDEEKAAKKAADYRIKEEKRVYDAQIKLARDRLRDIEELEEKAAFGKGESGFKILDYNPAQLAEEKKKLEKFLKDLAKEEQKVRAAEADKLFKFGVKLPKFQVEVPKVTYKEQEIVKKNVQNLYKTSKDEIALAAKAGLTGKQYQWLKNFEADVKLNALAAGEKDIMVRDIHSITDTVGSNLSNNISNKVISDGNRVTARLLDGMKKANIVPKDGKLSLNLNRPKKQEISVKVEGADYPGALGEAVAQIIKSIFARMTEENAKFVVSTVGGA